MREVLITEDTGFFVWMKDEVVIVVGLVGMEMRNEFLFWF